MDHDQHSSFIKTPRQLAIVVLLALAIPIAIAALFSQLATSGMEVAGTEDQIKERIKPVGKIVMAEATAPAGSLTGEQIFEQTCKTCHGPGIAGAPKAGDKAAWGPRISEGEATLFKHAVDGFSGKDGGVMPPKGGNASLTDDEVHRGVVYMANLAGAGWKETPVTAAAASATPAPAATSTKVAATAPAAAHPSVGAPADAAEGKKVYDETCHVCHGTGLLGSPKFGDKAAWAPRIATGMDTLYNAALHGLRAMPPKGGNANLTDAQVKAAVDYMTADAK